MTATESKTHNILMIGPGRSVMGGISTVVNTYYGLGLDQIYNLRYISTMLDGSKIKKLLVAVMAYIKFCFCIDQYDIIHVHMSADTSYLRKRLFINVAIKHLKKVIIHEHCGFFDEFFLERCNEKQKNKVRKVFSSADKVIVLSNKWYDFFANHVCNRSKLVIINNGIMHNKCIKKDYTDTNILYLGKLTKDKGIFDLLKAMHSVIKKIPNAIIYVGGSGYIRESQRLVRQLGIEKNVEFLGWIDGEEKEFYFKKCGVFVLTSYYEGMPIALLEAMSYGLAPITTNVGAIPEVISGIKDGLMFEPGDTEKLTELIVSLMKDISLKERIGKESADIVNKQYSADNTINKLGNLYDRL